MPKNKDEWTRVLIIGNVVLSSLLIVWGISVVSAPKFWFPGAYAEKGERGDKGPEGDKGPKGNKGPRGPRGPGVNAFLSRIGDLEYQISDLDSRLDETESAATEAYDYATDVCGNTEELLEILVDADIAYGYYTC